MVGKKGVLLMVIIIAAFFNDWRLEMFNRTVVSEITMKVLVIYVY